MQKHRVQELEHLIRLRDHLGERIESLTFSDERIAQLKEKHAALMKTLGEQAGSLHEKRRKSSEQMQKQVEEQLKQLRASGRPMDPQA